jgi:hypothetical protein
MSKPDAYKGPTLTNFRTLKDGIRPPGAPVTVKRFMGTEINGFTPTHKTGGPAWNEGLRAATPVQPTNNKGDGKDIGRGKVVTY